MRRRTGRGARTASPLSIGLYLRAAIGRTALRLEFRGTSAGGALVLTQLHKRTAAPRARAVIQVPYMADDAPTEYFIQGITSTGKKFRPSDWSERLAGVMSSFGPKASANARGPNAYLRYSLYVRPTMIGDLKVVVLDSRLKDIEPMAFNFVLNFAKDNDLVVTEACELPEDHATQQGGKR